MWFPIFNFLSFVYQKIVIMESFNNNSCIILKTIVVRVHTFEL